MINLVDATYRSELRELNELNFTRLDAKIDRVASELRVELANGIRNVEFALHRDVREQTRFLIGTMVALWAALLVPIVGLWFR